MPRPQGTYAKASIRGLKGCEPVEKRSGGHACTDNPLHIVHEVPDDATDEALAGDGHRIAVTPRTETESLPASASTGAWPLPLISWDTSPSGLA